MITRLFLGLLGIVSAAVAISAATHAVDFADSTVEDGDARFAIAAVAAGVFVGCVALLVANLRRARRSADADEGLESLATASPAAGRGITVARPVAAEPSPSSLADRLPGAAGARADAAAAAANRPIFAPSRSITPPSDADGLFDQRTPQRNMPFARPAEPVATEPPAHIVADAASLPPAADATPPVVERSPEPTPAPAPPTPEPTATTPPVARPLTLEQYSADDIDRTVDEQRNAAVDGLVRSGTLTTDGPLTADDIRTMLFIALSTEQLRSMLHDARSDDLPIWVEANDDPPTTGHLYVTGG